MKSRYLYSRLGYLLLIGSALGLLLLLFPRTENTCESVSSSDVSKADSPSNDVPRKIANSWKNWKDPLSQAELDALMRSEGAIRRKHGEASAKALNPTVSTVGLKSPIKVFNRMFGAAVAVDEKGPCVTVAGVLKEYTPRVSLMPAYFCFNNVCEFRSPETKKLFKLRFAYRDYQWESGPKGYFRDGQTALAKAREILNDLEERLGVPLQELRLFYQAWPYHPGCKLSQAWGGPIPERYICLESEWIKARHAFAHSRTIVGDYCVSFTLSQIYYDEYSIDLTILDKKELSAAQEIFFEKFRKRHPGKDGRVFGVRPPGARFELKDSDWLL